MAAIWKFADSRPLLMKLTAVTVTPDPETCTVFEVVWLNPKPKMLTGTVVPTGPRLGEMLLIKGPTSQRALAVKVSKVLTQHVVCRLQTSLHWQPLPGLI